MSTKIVTITRFPLPRGISPEDLNAGFKEIAPAFREVPGLIQKSFLISEDGRQAGGSYLWDSEEQARNFSENVVRSMIRERFGVDCQIEYFSSPVQVQGENRNAAQREDDCLSDRG